MSLYRSKQILIFCLTVFAIHSSSIAAQKQFTRQPRASSFRLEKHAEGLAHDLYVTVNGRERRVTKQAMEAWIIDGGRSVVYSALDGSGGYENEGQSLRIYDVRTRRIRKVLSEYFGIDAVMDVRLTTGQLALLVRMSDGGLGASYFAVVDPRRGEVFFRRWAEATRLNRDHVTLAFYKEDDWAEILDERAGKENDSAKVISQTKVKPVKTERHDLKRLLRRPVIHNKPTPR